MTVGGSHVRAVGRGGAFNLAGAGVSAVFGIVLSIVVAQHLSKPDTGMFFAATSFFLIIAAIARLGTPLGLVYYVSRLRELGQSSQIAAVIRIALVPVVVTSIVLGAILAVAAPALADLILGGDPRAVPVLRLLAFLLPVLALSDAVLAATRGFGQMRPTVLLDRIGRPIVQVLLAALVLGAGLGTVAVTGAWAVPYGITVVIAGFWLFRLVRGAGPQRPARAGLRTEFWRFNGPRAITSVVQLCVQRLDVVLVSTLRSPAEAATYAIASRVVTFGQLTNSALGLAAQPRLARLLAAGDRDGANEVYRTATAWIILLNGPLYLTVAFFSPLLLGVFGEQYVSAWPVTVALCVAAFIGNGVGMVDVMLSMAGRTTWNLANGVLALTVQVGLDLILIPPYGAFGAALGWGAAIITANVVPLIQLAKVDKLHPFGRGTALAAIVVTATVAIPMVLVVVAMGQTWLALAVALVLAGTIYGAVAWRLRSTLHIEALIASMRRSRTER
jgi:O-antigen/teichoic acid export membrane protein